MDGVLEGKTELHPKKKCLGDTEGGKVKRVGEYREDQKVGRREKNVRVSEGRR